MKKFLLILFINSSLILNAITFGESQNSNKGNFGNGIAIYGKLGFGSLTTYLNFYYPKIDFLATQGISALYTYNNSSGYGLEVGLGYDIGLPYDTKGILME